MKGSPPWTAPINQGNPVNGLATYWAAQICDADTALCQSDFLMMVPLRKVRVMRVQSHQAENMPPGRIRHLFLHPIALADQPSRLDGVALIGGWIEDFHPQAVVHARHTQNGRRIAPPPEI